MFAFLRRSRGYLIGAAMVVLGVFGLVAVASSADTNHSCRYEPMEVFAGARNHRTTRVRTTKVPGMVVKLHELNVRYDVPKRYYYNYPDISGDRVVYGVGYACPLTWDIKSKNLKTGEVIKFAGGGVHAQPKIDGDIIVLFGAKSSEGISAYDRSSITIYNAAAGKEPITLRAYTATESYSHPAISGTKVGWLEHLNVNPKGKPGRNRPYNICGADITNLNEPKFFTIATNVGRRDVTNKAIYEFDDVIDICGNTVVWEADGDIYAADISDLQDIKVFPVCTERRRQFDPAVSGNLVVWTDKRTDEGDIYAADISNPADIAPFEVIVGRGQQEQPAIDGRIIAYVDFHDSPFPKLGQIEACYLSVQPTIVSAPGSDKHHGARPEIAARYVTLEVPISEERYGLGPAIDKNRIVWQGKDNYRGFAEGIHLDIEYPTAVETSVSPVGAKR